MPPIFEVFNAMNSVMLLAILGGSVGLGALYVLGKFIKPNYYTRGQRASNDQAQG
jgi:hypothetical protein